MPYVSLKDVPVPDEEAESQLKEIVRLHLEDKDLPRRVITVRNVTGSTVLKPNVRLRVHESNDICIYGGGADNEVEIFSVTGSKLLNLKDTQIRVQLSSGCYLQSIRESKIHFIESVCDDFSAEKTEVYILNSKHNTIKLLQCIGDIRDCTFSGLASFSGHCRLVIQNCTFNGLISLGESEVFFENCTFGNPINVSESEYKFHNCNFSRSASFTKSTGEIYNSRFSDSLSVIETHGMQESIIVTKTATYDKSHQEIRNSQFLNNVTISNKSEMLIKKCQFMLNLTIEDSKSLIFDSNVTLNFISSKGRHYWEELKVKLTANHNEGYYHTVKYEVELDCSFNNCTIFQSVDDTYKKSITYKLKNRNKIKRATYKDMVTFEGLDKSRLKLTESTVEKELTFKGFFIVLIDQNDFKKEAVFKETKHLHLSKNTIEKECTIQDIEELELFDIKVNDSLTIKQVKFSKLLLIQVVKDATIKDCDLTLGTDLKVQKNFELDGLLQCMLNKLTISENLTTKSSKYINLDKVNISNNLTVQSVDDFNIVSGECKNLTGTSCSSITIAVFQCKSASLTQCTVIHLRSGQSESLTASNFSDCNLDQWDITGASSFSG